MRHTVHIVVYDQDESHAEALKSLSLVNDNVELTVSVIVEKDYGDSVFGVAYEELRLSQRAASLEVRKTAPALNWQALANQIFAASRSDYILLLSCRVFLGEHVLEPLIAALENDPELRGVNPLFMTYDRKWVSGYGFAIDSQLLLHSLFEGMAVDSAPVKVKRSFQFANPACMMTRRLYFTAKNGFSSKLEDMAFFDLCLKMKGKRGKYATVPQAQALWQNTGELLYDFLLWNSFAIRGKIHPGMVHADYHEYCLEAGLDYAISDWLWERPGEVSGVNFDDPWIKWRYNPDPWTLLAWLQTLDAHELREAIRICRSFGAALPFQFQYYRVKWAKLRQFAISSGLTRMQAALKEWQDRSKSFHYGKLRKGMRLLRQAGIYDASLDRCPNVYDAWLELAQPRPEFDKMEVGETWPAVAVAMPMYNPDTGFLKQAVESVLAQSYGDWQLCIADDASTDADARQFAESLAKDNDKIKTVFRPTNGHIAAAANSAIELASARWVAMMDQDDLLAEDALLHVAEMARKHPDAAIIYSDEDHIDEWNVRRSPVFRTAWESDTHLAGHLFAYSMQAMRDAGFFRSGFDGSQDYDLNLRIAEKSDAEQIIHIPHILYHWRVHGGSTAGTVASKPYILEATRKAFEEAALRRSLQGTPEMGKVNNSFRLRYFGPCGHTFGIVLLDWGYAPSPKLNRSLLDLRDRLNVRFYQISFGRRAVDTGLPAQRLSPEIDAGIWREFGDCHALLFVDTRLEPLAECDPGQLLYLVLRNDVALAGGLVWAGHALWHGGLAPDVTGLPFRLLKGTPAREIFSFCWCRFNYVHESLGPSSYLFGARREVMEEANAFLPGCNDLAMCQFMLGQLRKGRKCLITPLTQFGWRFSPDIQKPGNGAEAAFCEKWGEELKKNGLRNPNLRAAPDYDWTLNLPVR